MADRLTAANPRIVTCDPVEGFTPQIGRYVAQMTEVRNDLKEQLTGLTQEQLDWHPDEQTESIGTLLLHTAAVEWSWLHQDISGATDDEYTGSWEEAMPIRVKEPQVSGRAIEDYLQHLDAIREQTLEVLRGFSDDDLKRLVGEGDPPRGWEPRSVLYTIDWIIWHVIEHEATHVGQVELLRRLAPKS